MVGDRLTDIDCGLRAGTKTILVGSTRPPIDGAVAPDFIVENLREAAQTILWVDERSET